MIDRQWRGWRTMLIVALVQLCATNASAHVNDVILSDYGAIDKRPHVAGDWVVWTTAPQALDSWGLVLLQHRVSGVRIELGAGFDPDVTLLPVPKINAPDGGSGGNGSGSAGAAAGMALVQGPAAPQGVVVRVAWLRFAPDGSLEVVEASVRPSGAVKTRLLASGLAWADHVRVDGDLTVWSADDGSGLPAIFASAGQGSVRVSTSGAPAMRPVVTHDAAGTPAVLWDEYLGDSDDFDYEVFLSQRQTDGNWSEPENLSQAPGVADHVASVAAAPDGSLWVAFGTDRGTSKPYIFVLRRAPDGSISLPASYPASSDPAQRGIVDLKVHRSTHDPELAFDALGRLWLFVTELPTNGFGATPYDKQLHYALYSGGAWSAAELLTIEPRGEQAVDLAPLGDGMLVVYQGNGPDPAFDLQIVSRALTHEAVPLPLIGWPPAGPPAAPIHPALPSLPVERQLDIDGVPHTLVFADLHSHSERSPDGMGELDHAIGFARDVVHLDVWASVNHDSRDEDHYLDFEYEQDRRLIERLGTGFTAFMGFEWTSNDGQTVGGQDIGHRATFDSSRVYRYTDADSDELSEFYALMTAEGAIGVPHHLGKLGGATFLEFDPYVQPVTEVASVHGQYEAQLQEKLLVDGKRFGVICGGDDHNAKPGRGGIAGVWVPTSQLGDREAFKQALRDRRCFGARPDGAWMDVKLQGVVPGSELVHSGDLLLEFDLREVAAAGQLNVNLLRDGAWADPVYQRVFEPGEPLVDSVLVSGTELPAIYMLRVTKGTGTAPASTVLWSSPIWVDPPTAPPGH